MEGFTRPRTPDGGLKSPKIEITGEDSFHLSLTEVVCAPDVHLLVNVRV